VRIVAYIYTDPLLEPVPDQNIWGWDVDKVYQDLGGRSQLQELLCDCQVTVADYLLVRRLEELGDTVEEVWDSLNQLEATGLMVIVTEQNYTSKNAHPQRDLIKLIQQVQYQQRSKRIRQGHARNRLAATPPPGKAPYGYIRRKGKYIIDRSTSPVVKDFFEQFLLYCSLSGSVRYLTKKYGKKISVTTAKRWLTNPVYRGDTAYQNGEIISNTHVPIISREVAAQVDRLLRRNSRLAPRAASAPRSLAGLVVCQQCQSPMRITRVTQRHQDKEYLYLRALDCPQKPKCSAISYQEVLENTITTVCRELPAAVAGINFSQLDEVKQNLSQAIERQQAILQQLPDLIDTGVLDVETTKLRAYKIQTEISLLQAKLASLPPVNLRSVAQAVSLTQFWLDLSEVERRFYFREFIRQIEVVRQNQQWDLRVILIF
jgi:DNA invertase Pin-like site-specific DNA recombinase